MPPPGTAMRWGRSGRDGEARAKGRDVQRGSRANPFAKQQDRSPPRPPKMSSLEVTRKLRAEEAARLAEKAAVEAGGGGLSATASVEEDAFWAAAIAAEQQRIQTSPQPLPAAASDDDAGGEESAAAGEVGGGGTEAVEVVEASASTPAAHAAHPEAPAASSPAVSTSPPACIPTASPSSPTSPLAPTSPPQPLPPPPKAETSPFQSSQAAAPPAAPSAASPLTRASTAAACAPAARPTEPSSHASPPQRAQASHSSPQQRSQGSHSSPQPRSQSPLPVAPPNIALGFQQLSTEELALLQPPSGHSPNARKPAAAGGGGEVGGARPCKAAQHTESHVVDERADAKAEQHVGSHHPQQQQQQQRSAPWSSQQAKDERPWFLRCLPDGAGAEQARASRGGARSAGGSHNSLAYALGIEDDLVLVHETVHNIAEMQEVILRRLDTMTARVNSLDSQVGALHRQQTGGSTAIFRSAADRFMRSAGIFSGKRSTSNPARAEAEPQSLTSGCAAYTHSRAQLEQLAALRAAPTAYGC